MIVFLVLVLVFKSNFAPLSRFWPKNPQPHNKGDGDSCSKIVSIDKPDNFVLFFCFEEKKIFWKKNQKQNPRNIKNLPKFSKNSNNSISVASKQKIRNQPRKSPFWNRGEHNVENLKLIRHCHKSCKTHPKGKKIIY